LRARARPTGRSALKVIGGTGRWQTWPARAGTPGYTDRESRQAVPSDRAANFSQRRRYSRSAAATSRRGRSQPIPYLLLVHIRRIVTNMHEFTLVLLCLGLLIFITNILYGIVGAMIGARKGQGGLAFVLGVLFGRIGVLIAFFSSGNRKTCPYCRELIHKDATVCPHCQRDQPKPAPPRSPSVAARQSVESAPPPTS